MSDKPAKNSAVHMKYNDTADYKYLELAGVLGAFTKAPIQPETLPSGFRAFSLLGRPNFERIAPAPNKKSEGTFICKEEEAAGIGHGRGVLAPEDCVFCEATPFEFEAFFGHKLSLECMISQADEKRMQQLSNPEKSQDGRENSSL